MTPPTHLAITSFTYAYRFLSNFYPCTIAYEGITYKSLEHAYQAAKSLLPAEREKIRRCPTAAIAKRKGRHVTLRPDWEAVKFDIMRDLLRQKFTGDFVLRCSLISTGDAELIETNSWGDRVWGVCGGKGENWLGKLLMEVRAELQKETSSTSAMSG